MFDPKGLSTKRYKQIRALITGGHAAAKAFKSLVTELSYITALTTTVCGQRKLIWGRGGCSDERWLPEHLKRGLDSLYAGGVITDGLMYGYGRITIHPDVVGVYLRPKTPPIDVLKSHDSSDVKWLNLNVRRVNKPYSYVFESRQFPADRLYAVVTWLDRISPPDRLSDHFIDLIGSLIMGFRHPEESDQEGCGALQVTCDYLDGVHVGLDLSTTHAIRHVSRSSNHPWTRSYRMRDDSNSTSTPESKTYFDTPTGALKDLTTWATFGAIASTID